MDMSEEKTRLELVLGNKKIPVNVDNQQRGIYEQASKLFNERFKYYADDGKKGGFDENVRLTMIALEFAIRYYEERNSKSDNILAPAAEDAITKIEKALDELEKK